MTSHRPRKRFGQHFLADPHYVARIVDAVAPQPGDNVVEIGPGLGALTSALIDRAGPIAAIEIDRDLAARLRERFPPERLAELGLPWGQAFPPGHRTAAPTPLFPRIETPA